VRTFEEQMQRKPEEILRHAVKGMLPKNRLGRKLIKKLKIYVGPNHPHQAQRPEILEI
jgi:large subunit ribosomal protein L13